ncbi:MAG: hypothetical protein WC028_28680 [Candidatus Obscuribacterales bacterium]
MVFIYLRSSKVFIQAMGKTEGFGVWVSYGPVAKSTLLDPQLGNLIVDTFQHSVAGIKHPSKAQWPFVLTPLLEAAGVKTESTLRRGLKTIQIIETDNNCSLQPSIRGDEQPEKTRHCKFDPVELSKAVLETLPDAEYLVGR